MFTARLAALVEVRTDGGTKLPAEGITSNPSSMEDDVSEVQKLEFRFSPAFCDER